MFSFCISYTQIATASGNYRPYFDNYISKSDLLANAP